MMIYRCVEMHGRASLLVLQALFCRLLQLTVKRIRGKASSSVGFSPFNKRLSHWCLKGFKPTEESGKAGEFPIRSLKRTAKESLRHGATPH